MHERHSLLRRQLRRAFGREDEAPSSVAPLLGMVDEAYKQFDVDRKMLERSLELVSQELMNVNADNRAALEGLLDMYLRIDEEGTILYCRFNKHKEIGLISMQDLTGKGIGDLFPRPVVEMMMKSMRTVITSGDTVRMEYNQTRGGQECFFEVWMSPLLNRQISVMIRDISESRNAQMREQDLQHRLARSQRMESLGMLAGGVAHDLNNILSPLVAYPDMILESMESSSPARRLITQMQNSAIRASTIIQDLLALARRGNFSPEPVDLNKLVFNYIQTADFHVLKNRFGNVAFSSQLPTQLPAIEASANYINQIVMNLAINAFEAIEGEGRVTITTDAINVEDGHGVYDVIPPGSYVRLTVADTGVGMSSKEIEHIFEPFYTLKKSGKSGTGLGLTVVYGSVKDCKGYIDVVSASGKGTEFMIYFPASSKTLPVVVPAKKEDIRGSARVLVVDDIPEQRTLAKHLLSHLGYQVETAGNGREALDIIRDQPMDLVLLDMILGDDLDGLDIYLAIRGIRSDQRCIIVSGFSENDRVRTAIEHGVLAYVQKPYTLDVLGRAIREALVKS